MSAASKVEPLDNKVVRLNPRGRQQAMTLFAKNIAAVRRSEIDDGTSADTRTCEAFLRSYDASVTHDVMYWAPRWTGVFLALLTDPWVISDPGDRDGVRRG